jgi:pyruvate/2-oxoacid:ferredoxin oxidoreductase beta subunit
MAGAGYVAQVSPAFPQEFVRATEEALACPRTAVLFVPAPCITGWKYEEGHTEHLAKLASQSGLFPCFFKKAGHKGEVKHVDLKGHALEEFLSLQRRFNHLVRRDAAGYQVVAGAQPLVDRIRDWCRTNVARLEFLSKWNCPAGS